MQKRASTFDQNVRRQPLDEATVRRGDDDLVVQLLLLRADGQSDNHVICGIPSGRTGETDRQVPTGDLADRRLIDTVEDQRHQIVV